MLICIVGFASVVAMAQDRTDEYAIDQSRGIDQSVDYKSLHKYGPWDDRNYALTAEDLKYLSADEHNLHNQLPAFFRIELRKEMPHLPRSGPVQYPRSALQLFELRHGGLQRDAENKPENRSKMSMPCGNKPATVH